MKQLKLSQEEIDILWSAVINQENVEKILRDSANDAGEYVKHDNKMFHCRVLMDQIRKLGVTNVSLKG